MTSSVRPWLLSLTTVFWPLCFGWACWRQGICICCSWFVVSLTTTWESTANNEEENPNAEALVPSSECRVYVCTPWPVLGLRFPLHRLRSHLHSQFLPGRFLPSSCCSACAQQTCAQQTYKIQERSRINDFAVDSWFGWGKLTADDGPGLDVYMYTSWAGDGSSRWDDSKYISDTSQMSNMTNTNSIHRPFSINSSEIGTVSRKK